MPCVSHVTIASVLVAAPLIVLPVYAQYQYPGSEFRMESGAAGTVTAKVHPGNDWSSPRVDIYSAGLNVGAKNLRGQRGASIFVVDDKGYVFAWNEPSTGDPQEGYAFHRYGKTYKCTPLR
jgi:hypothetical protein